jgi:U32 family peptidase
MQLTSYAHTTKEIDQLASSGAAEIILTYAPLSRVGGSALLDVELLAKHAHELGLPVTLEWDVLVVERDFISSCTYFSQLPINLFSAIRVADFGVMQFLFESYPSLKLIPILEGRCHNFESIIGVLELLPKRVERVVLSIELSGSELEKIIPKLPVPCELLLLGPIPLYYSPRHLLSPLIEDKRLKGARVDLLATSEEGPHSGFPLIESDHGTVVYNTRHLWLLDSLLRLREIGVTMGRIELRSIEKRDHKIELLQQIGAVFTDFSEELVEEIKGSYPFSTIHGFFRANKSDVLFPKLKNHRLIPLGSDHLGEVVDVIRGEMVAIVLCQDASMLQVGSSLKLVTPEGRELFVKLSWCRNSQGEDITSPIKRGEIILINPIKRVTVKSQLYQHIPEESHNE